MQVATAWRDHGPDNAVASARYVTSAFWLLLLVAADSAFVVVHLVNKLSPLVENKLYSLGQDGGYAEIFQYLKIYWIAIMLGALWSRTREPFYAAWMLLYAYLLCDDALRIHEIAGGAIASAWGYREALGLRPQDFGELTVSGAAGLTFLIVISATYLRASVDARNICRDLALLLGLLVFFGVFVDMLHIMAKGRYLREALGIAEDGGEMLAVSAACWYVLRLLEHRGNAPAPLWPRVLGVLSARRFRSG